MGDKTYAQTEDVGPTASSTDNPVGHNIDDGDAGAKVQCSIGPIWPAWHPPTCPGAPDASSAHLAGEYDSVINSRVCSVYHFEWRWMAQRTARWNAMERASTRQVQKRGEGSARGGWRQDGSLRAQKTSAMTMDRVTSPRRGLRAEAATARPIQRRVLYSFGAW